MQAGKKNIPKENQSLYLKEKPSGSLISGGIS